MVICGVTNVAVTVALAFIVTLQAAAFAVQPDHEPKVLAPVAAGAVRVTAVPAL